MKIVHVEDYFHPDAGYQLNILAKYMVKEGHDVTIITSEMEKIPVFLTSFFGKEDIKNKDLKYEQLTGVNIVRLPLKGFISGRAIFGKELNHEISKLKPDVLYIHGNDTLTGIRYIFNIKNLTMTLITDSHMLEMASTNPFNKLFRLFYKFFITPKIIKYKLPVIRTQNDDYVNKYLGIPLNQCPWISVGSDTLLFHPNEKIKAKFREELKISPNDFVIVYTGKLDETKGGLLLAKAFEKKIKTEKNIILLVVGSTVGEYGKKVEQIFNNSENRIIRFDTQKYINLAKFYQVADLSVFPKQSSLSFYDAQACGLPVISEDNNININRLTKNNGFCFKSGNVDDLIDKIIKCSNLSSNEFNRMGKNAHNFVKENYDYREITKEYMDVIIKHNMNKKQKYEMEDYYD